MNIDDHLDKVEAYGFQRDVFPLSYNGHHIHLLQNDARVTDDERLQVHFTLYCDYCEEEFAVHGHSHPETTWRGEHVQDVKALVIGPYIVDDCPIGGYQASGCQN